MKVRLDKQITFELFQIEEWKMVKRIAEKNNREVYSWKTEGKSNWFEKGFSIVDSLGLVLLAEDLPNQISLPDDR